MAAETTQRLDALVVLGAVAPELRRHIESLPPEEARKEAFALIDAAPDLTEYPLLKAVLRKKWMGRLELIKS